jgi:hypothetical protein
VVETTGAKGGNTMRRYHGNDEVGPGIYFNLREMVFRSMDEEGRLPGGERDVWRAVPAALLLLAGPVLGLAYAMFLPLIGFLMLGGLLARWAVRQVGLALNAAGRVLSPAWQPALAFFGRGRAAKREAKTVPAAPDPWAEQVRTALDEPAPPEADEEKGS